MHTHVEGDRDRGKDTVRQRGKERQETEKDKRQRQETGRDRDRETRDRDKRQRQGQEKDSGRETENPIGGGAFDNRIQQTLRWCPEGDFYTFVSTLVLSTVQLTPWTQKIVHRGMNDRLSYA